MCSSHRNSTVVCERWRNPRNPRIAIITGGNNLNIRWAIRNDRDDGVHYRNDGIASCEVAVHIFHCQHDRICTQISTSEQITINGNGRNGTIVRAASI